VDQTEPAFAEKLRAEALRIGTSQAHVGTVQKPLDMGAFFTELSQNWRELNNDTKSEIRQTDPLVGELGDLLDKIRVLFVACCPSDEARIRVDAEHRVIIESIGANDNKILLKHLPAATVDDLRRAMLATDFHVVHFSGHSDPEFLFFETTDGITHPVRLQELESLIKRYQSVQCVILNSCKSAKNLRTPMSQITVGMEENISDEVAIEFARGFYDALAAGRAIEFAVEEGVSAVQLKGLNADPITVLKPCMRVYYDRDADLNLIKGKKVAIIGYGSQGHAHALNLRDSGVKDVAVALRKGSARPRRPKAEGSRSWTRRGRQMGRRRDDADARRIAGRHLSRHLHANMKDGAALMFAHGLNVHFNLIEPRADIDVLMIAPKGPGHTVRSEYQRGGGVPCLVAVHAGRRPATRHDLGLSYASAIGGGRAGIIETSFREECETDLFGEQVGAVRRPGRTDEGRLRDAGRSRLRAGDGLFRVPARGEADRRPDLRGRHRQHELFDLQHRRIRRIRLRPAHRHRRDQGRDEARPRRHPVRPLRARLDAGEQGQPDLVQGDARAAARRASDRAGRRQAARDDAVDRQEQAGRQVTSARCRARYSASSAG
jgi:hypothetical protein